MSKVRLTIGDLVAFRFKGEYGNIKIGIKGEGIHSHSVYYNGTIYRDSELMVVEYGRNNGEYSNLYKAIENAFPSHVNKHPEDMVDYILKKDLKVKDLAKIEKEYNKIINRKSRTDTLFNKR